MTSDNIHVFSGATKIFISRLKSAELLVHLQGDVESLDGEMLCGPTNLTFLTGKILRVLFSPPVLQNSSRLQSLYLFRFTSNNLKTILTLDTTVINACAIRNGSVSGLPYSKQSFMRERPFFPQNRQT